MLERIAIQKWHYHCWTLLQNWLVFQLGVEHLRIQFHQNRRNCKNFIGLYQKNSIFIFVRLNQASLDAYGHPRTVHLPIRPYILEAWFDRNDFWSTFLINLPHGNIKLASSREFTSSWWCINDRFINQVNACFLQKHYKVTEQKNLSGRNFGGKPFI